MDYFLRATQSDWPELLSLGVTLGILAVNEDGKHYGINGAGWDDMPDTGGLVYRPTGEYVTVPLDEPEIGVEDGQPYIRTEQQIELTAPVLAPDGLPYVHANLRTDFDLRERAEQLAAENPDLAVALSNLPRFFVTDENGAPKRPAVPARVFF